MDHTRIRQQVHRFFALPAADTLPKLTAVIEHVDDFAWTLEVNLFKDDWTEQEMLKREDWTTVQLTTA